MYTHATKQQGSNQLPAKGDVAKQHGEHTDVPQFTNSRSGAIARLEEAGQNGQQVRQLKAYQAMADNYIAQLKEKPNNTGLPDQLKSGIESLSGMSMDHVKVHYNSEKPAQLNAHAYAQGSEIHVASGQEKHVAHEAWHVVQQAQGRVKPTMQLKAGVPVNDDAGLEKEADIMGEKALQTAAEGTAISQRKAIAPYDHPVYQLATKITHTVGTVPFAGKNYLVGKKMVASLDPDEVVTGSATTADNYDWMKGIRAYYGPAGVIRGHLLNHDLGGYGVPENLYPISSMANSEHSDQVEQKVKGALTDSAKGTKTPINYTVTVDEEGPVDVPYEKAAFECKWSDESGNVFEKRIESNLLTDKGWGGKSKGALKSPYAWRHGKRRGEENMDTPLGDGRIVIDKSPLGLFVDYDSLRDRTLDSKGISDVQDWEEAIKMISNELDELGALADPLDPPKILIDGNNYLVYIQGEVVTATTNGTLAQLTVDKSEQMMNNLKAIRAERIYLQEGIDEELNEEINDIDMTDV